MQLDYTVKQFSKDLINDFLLLCKISFTSTITINRIINLFGNQEYYLGYLAYVNNKAIAFFGAIESDFIMNGSHVIAAQSAFSMVHPQFRSGNYFYELHSCTVELARQRGVKFIFGWPNSPRIFEKLLEWKNLGPFSKITIHVKTIPLSILARRWRLFYPIFHWYSNLILSFFKRNLCDDVTQLLNAEKLNYIPRSPDYLKYKQKSGAKIFKLAGKYLLVNHDHRLKIGDIQPFTINDFNNMLSILKRIAFFAGIAEIVFYTDKNNKFFHEIIYKFNGKDDINLLYYEVDKNIKISLLDLTFADFDTF